MDKDLLVVESAKALLPFIASLDPLWADEIHIMEQERGWDALQVIGALCGYTLEQQAHMWIPQHPFFSDNHHPTGSKLPCRQCEQTFVAAYPGQFLCSNACANVWYPSQQAAKDPPIVHVPSVDEFATAAEEQALEAEAAQMAGKKHAKNK